MLNNSRLTPQVSPKLALSKDSCDLKMSPQPRYRKRRRVRLPPYLRNGSDQPPTRGGPPRSAWRFECRKPV